MPDRTIRRCDGVALVAAVVRTPTDFLHADLKGDTVAARRIETDAVRGVTRVVFDTKAGSTVTVPTAPTTPGRVHHASLSHDSGLTDGQPVPVNWTGDAPGTTVNVVQCCNRIRPAPVR